MTKTKQVSRSQRFTSPAPSAPVVIGVVEGEGGEDALQLGRLIGEVRGARCVAAVDDTEGTTAQARRILGAGVKIDAVGFVNPSQILLEYAALEKAGTLVLGSSRRGRLGRALVGNVADHAVDHAPCEVVVAPRGYAAERHGGFGKIAVAVDGSEESKVALTRAEDLARKAGASIEVLVADDPVVSGLEATAPTGAPPAFAKVMEGAVQTVDPALRPTGRRVETGRRQIARTIAAALAGVCPSDVDLLVAGSRRAGAHLFGASVAKHLVEAAPCPVLVVPHSREI
jgi:nucleotide-binding universal stress UspA family protein